MRNIITEIRLLTVVAAFVCSGHAWSIASLTDEDMGDISGQDGLTLQFANAVPITATQVEWQDNSLLLADKQFQLQDISLTGLDSTFKLDVAGGGAGAYAAIPSLAMNIAVKPFLFQVGKMCVDAAGSSAACAGSFGEMALKTNSDTTLDFYNTRGVLDATTGATAGTGKLTFDLSNAEFYTAHSLNSQRDLILLKNLYLKGSMTGSFSIDGNNGLRMLGDLSLPRAGAINGLNMDLAINPNVASGFTTAGSTNLLHLGMSGTIQGFDFHLAAGGSNTIISGADVADSGVKISAAGELKTSDFEFEIGEGDASGYAVRFKNFVSLLNGNSATPSNGSLNLGSLYVNVVPANVAMLDVRTGFGSLLQTTDTLGLAIRDFELVDYPRSVELYKYSDGTTISMNPSGTLMLPLYDLDANLMLMSGGHPAVAAGSRRGIGFNLKAAVTGTNAGGVGPAFTGDKITGLLLADTSSGVGQYIGLRNLNGYITWQQGQFFPLDPATDGVSGLRLTSANNVQINLDGQFALDYLPDGTAAKKIKTTGHLFGLSVQVQSAGTTLSVIPSPAGQSYLGITGSLNLQAGSNSGLGGCSGGAAGTGTCVAITEPVDGSQVQFSTISGKINLTDSRIDIGKDAVATSGLGGSFARGYVRFENTIQFDPGLGYADVVRIGDVNFLGGGSAASPTPIASYRLGEIVIPGGELYTRIDLRQR